MENSLKDFWPNARLQKRINHDGSVVIELYNTSRISHDNPELKKRIREVDSKFNQLYDILGKDSFKEIWKKYGDRIHGFEYESDKKEKSIQDERCQEILELIFNMLYGEMLKLEKQAFQSLDEVEKEIDVELEKVKKK